MCKLSTENVAKYFSISMGMSWEACLRRHTVFVKNTKATERIESRVVVIRKGNFSISQITKTWLRSTDRCDKNQAIHDLRDHGLKTVVG